MMDAGRAIRRAAARNISATIEALRRMPFEAHEHIAVLAELLDEAQEARLIDILSAEVGERAEMMAYKSAITKKVLAVIGDDGNFGVWVHADRIASTLLVNHIENVLKGEE